MRLYCSQIAKAFPFLIGKVLTLADKLKAKKEQAAKAKFPFLIGKVLTMVNVITMDKVTMNDQFPFLIGKVLTRKVLWSTNVTFKKQVFPFLIGKVLTDVYIITRVFQCSL